MEWWKILLIVLGSFGAGIILMILAFNALLNEVFGGR